MPPGTDGPMCMPKGTDGPMCMPKGTDGPIIDEEMLCKCFDKCSEVMHSGRM